VAAVVIAIAGVVVLLLGSGAAPFTIKANFLNASQLVRGDLVQVSGDSVGAVTDIELTRNGQAQLTLKIDKAYAPLRHGTELTVRQASLSGIANRYVDLRLGPANAPPTTTARWSRPRRRRPRSTSTSSSTSSVRASAERSRT